MKTTTKTTTMTWFPMVKRTMGPANAAAPLLRCRAREKNTIQRKRGLRRKRKRGMLRDGTPYLRTYVRVDARSIVCLRPGIFSPLLPPISPLLLLGAARRKEEERRRRGKRWGGASGAPGSAVDGEEEPGRSHGCWMLGPGHVDRATGKSIAVHIHGLSPPPRKSIALRRRGRGRDGAVGPGRFRLLIGAKSGRSLGCGYM